MTTAGCRPRVAPHKLKFILSMLWHPRRAKARLRELFRIVFAPQLDRAIDTDRLPDVSLVPVAGENDLCQKIPVLCELSRVSAKKEKRQNLGKSKSCSLNCSPADQSGTCPSGYLTKCRPNGLVTRVTFVHGSSCILGLEKQGRRCVMKHSNINHAKDDQANTPIDDEAANENYRQIDSDELEASSGFFKRRSKFRTRMNHREWWIVAGMYAILIGIAVVVV